MNRKMSGKYQDEAQKLREYSAPSIIKGIKMTTAKDKRMRRLKSKKINLNFTLFSPIIYMRECTLYNLRGQRRNSYFESLLTSKIRITSNPLR